MAYRQDLYMFALGQMSNGKTQEKCSEELNQLIQDCRRTGKKGQLILTLDIKPDKGDNGQYFIKPTIKTKSPQLDPGETLFWGTPEGNLQRHDPAQGSFDLKVAPEEKREVKFIDDKTPTVKKL